MREISEEENQFSVYKKFLVDKLKGMERKKEEKLSRENRTVRRLRWGEIASDCAS